MSHRKEKERKRRMKQKEKVRNAKIHTILTFPMNISVPVDIEHEAKEIKRIMNELGNRCETIVHKGQHGESYIEITSRLPNYVIENWMKMGIIVTEQPQKFSYEE